MNINLYNTASRALEAFQPLIDNKVRIYACGPTVYNYAHLGNFRTFIFEDLLVRTLRYAGYDLTHVMNVTDVGHLSDDGDEGEDKLIKSARERGMSPWDIAEYYTKAFFRDSDKLGIERPSIVCKATDHIQEMIELIRKLEDGGYTYQAGGNVYFDVSRFERYGKLARLDLSELRAGARIEVDAHKKNPQDFVLWFTQSKFGRQAMMWESPWGLGYPGWHIECSAMSRKYLGDQFDIHCGGVDHIAVHHTNEIAQTEAATGKHPSVSFWMHAEFLLTKEFKMSKSSGNFLTLEALEQMGYHPMDYRFFCLGAHYRTQLTFSEQAMNAARNGRKSLLERISQLPPVTDSQPGFGKLAEEYLGRFEAALGEDLNTPRALAELWGVVKDTNLLPEEKRALVSRMDLVLGLGLDQVVDQDGEDPASSVNKEEVEQLIEQRMLARRDKNFAEADRIRDDLQKMGIRLIDSPEGTKWQVLKDSL